MAEVKVLEAKLSSLRSELSNFDASVLDGDAAARLCGELASVANACAAAKASCARRVAETAEHSRRGHKDPARWLAGLSGESQGEARRLLQAADDLAGAPLVQEAFSNGELSVRQAEEIASAVKLDPSSEHSLLEASRTSSVEELRHMADQVRQAARSAEEAEARYARIRANRHVKHWTERDGACGGRFSLTPEDGAVVINRLTQIADDLFDGARRAGVREPHRAYLADALVLLAGGRRPSPPSPDDGAVISQPPGSTVHVESSDTSPAPGSTGTPGPTSTPNPTSTPGPTGEYGSIGSTDASATAGTACSTSDAGRSIGEAGTDVTVLAHVSLEALLRGYVLPGEECQISGTGHVPVSVVQRMLDTGKLRLIVESGTEIASVFSFRRHIPQALRTALEHRDRTCVVPGCSSTFRLEIDHILPVEQRGPTTLKNLCRLCRMHHAMKTTEGYEIRGGPGHWEWIPPPSIRPRPPTVPRRTNASSPPSSPSPALPESPPDTALPASPPPAPLPVSAPPADQPSLFPD